jgi:hypothetical protein
MLRADEVEGGGRLSAGNDKDSQRFGQGSRQNESCTCAASQGGHFGLTGWVRASGRLGRESCVNSRTETELRRDPGVGAPRDGVLRGDSVLYEGGWKSQRKHRLIPSRPRAPDQLPAWEYPEDSHHPPPSLLPAPASPGTRNRFPEGRTAHRSPPATRR